MVAVPAERGAAESRSKGRPVDNPAGSAELVAEVVQTSWFVSVGVAFWHLRSAFISGAVSAAVHFVAIIALAMIHAPPPLYVRTPPELPLDASLVKQPKTPPVLPRFVEAKMQLNPNVQSVVKVDNKSARGGGSVGSGGGRGGGSDGGTALLGSVPGTFNKSGGTGSGIDDAFGTHMLGELGELGDPAASFFGIKTGGKRFVYVVDCSGSMAQNKRFLRCQTELLRSLTSLTYGQQYLVIYFSSKMDAMPENQLVDVRPEQMKKTVAWVMNHGLGGGTQPWDSLKRALVNKPDAVFFLTDGIFDPDVVEKVRRIQPETKKRIPIHCIAFEDPVGAELMQMIANHSGGEFKYVP